MQHLPPAQLLGWRRERLIKGIRKGLAASCLTSMGGLALHWLHESLVAVHQLTAVPWVVRSAGNSACCLPALASPGQQYHAAMPPSSCLTASDASPELDSRQRPADAGHALPCMPTTMLVTARRFRPTHPMPAAPCPSLPAGAQPLCSVPPAAADGSHQVAVLGPQVPAAPAEAGGGQHPHLPPLVP